MPGTSQFARELRCLYCGKHNPASEWPELGDLVPFYYQAECGPHNVTMNCAHCERTWYVVWDDYPGKMTHLAMDTETQQEVSAIESEKVSDLTKAGSQISSMPSGETRIRFHCPKCSSAIRVSTDYAGKRGKCPRCNAQLTIPRPMREGTDWYCKGSARIIGPLSSQKLRQLASKGSLTREDLVKKGSAGQWVKAERIKDLFKSPRASKATEGAGKRRVSSDKTASRRQMISDDQVLNLLSDDERTEKETTRPSRPKQETSVIESINEQIAWSYGVLPVEIEGDVMKVAIAAGNASHIAEKSAMLQFILARPVEVKMIPMWELREAIERQYPLAHRVDLEIETALLARSLAGAPVERVIPRILSLAVRVRASAIFLLPREESLRVFLRTPESKCPYEFTSLPRETKDYIISFLKENTSREGTIILSLDEGQAAISVKFRCTPWGDAAVLSLDKKHSLFDETMAVGFFEDKLLQSDGMCSDDQCPCNEVSIHRGQGYLYIPEDVVRFRWCYRGLAEAERHMEEAPRILSIDGRPAMVRLGAILVCEVGQRLRKLDLEVANADARRWWQTGKVPLRTTPLDNSAKNHRAYRRESEEESQNPGTPSQSQFTPDDPSALDLPEVADRRDLDWLEKKEPHWNLARLNKQLQSGEEQRLQGIQLIDSLMIRTPDLWILYSWAASFRLKLNRVSEARGLLQKALQACPQRTYLYQKMAEVAKQESKLPEALGWSIKSVMAAQAIGVNFDNSAMCLILQVAEFHGRSRLSRAIQSRQSTEATASAVHELLRLYHQCSLDEKDIIDKYLTIFELRYGDILDKQERDRQQAIASLEKHRRRCPEHGTTYRLLSRDGDKFCVKCDQCDIPIYITADTDAEDEFEEKVAQALLDAASASADELSQPDDSPLLRLVNLIFQEAVTRAASEIRLIPDDDAFVLQFLVFDTVQTSRHLSAKTAKRIRNILRGMADVRGRGILKLASGETAFLLRSNKVIQGVPVIIELPSHAKASGDSQSSNEPFPAASSLYPRIGKFSVTELINDQLALKHEILPLSIVGDYLEVAIGDENRSSAAFTEEMLVFILERPVHMIHVPYPDLQKALSREYSQSREAGYRAASEMAVRFDKILDSLRNGNTLDVAEEVVRQIVRVATTTQATSIYFFPGEHWTEIFVRSQGELCPCEITSLASDGWSLILNYFVHNTRRDGKLRLTLGEANSYFDVEFRDVLRGQAMLLRLLASDGLYRGCPHCGRNLASARESKGSRIVRKLENHRTNDKTGVLETTVCMHCSSMDLPNANHVREAWRQAGCQQCGMKWTYPGVIICPQCEFDHALRTPRVKPRIRPAYVLPFAAQQWPKQE